MKTEFGGQQAKVVAFYSYPAGLGCSGLVANLALILGSQGYRVLTVDADSADPSLSQYLSVLLPDAPAVPAAPVPLDCQFANPRGMVAMASPAMIATAAVSDSPSFTMERASLVASGYDFVLIDMPPGPESVPAASELADVVVLGYGLNRRAMLRVAQDAQKILSDAKDTALQVLPLPMRVDRKAGSTTEGMLVAGRLAFAWLLHGWPEARRQSYLAEVHVPYEPDYTVDEGIAFLDDSSAQRDRLVGCYLRLAQEIVPAPSPGARAMVTDETRARYRAGRLAAVSSSAAVTVLHAPTDRYWAEWLVSELRRMNVDARARRLDHALTAGRADSELLVVSAGLLALQGLDDCLAALTSGPPDGQVRVTVCVDGARLAASQFQAHGQVILADLTREQAQAELASYYRMAGLAAADDPALRFPGRPGHGDVTFSLPPGDGGCFGRDDEIDQVRDRLIALDGPPPLVISGPAGIGKTRLALEYVSRFARHYDLVAWIRADSPLAIRTDLSELASRFPDLNPGGDVVLSVLRYLNSDRGGAPLRWLLVYDGAPSPAVLDGLLPEPGRGHILATARLAGDTAPGGLAVQPLPADAAKALLASLLPIQPDEADLIVACLDNVPLALRLAGGWLNIVVRRLLGSDFNPATVVSNAVLEFLEQAETAAAQAPVNGVTERDPVRLTVELLLRRLREEAHGDAALLLLETCAFLAPAGMSGLLLDSPGMLRQLIAADPALRDPVLVNNVRATLADFELAVRGLTAQEPLRLQPRVREILRERLPEPERAARASAVTRVLAAHAPLAIEDDVIGHEVYAELLQHVAPSRAAEQLDDEVRRWLVNQVRYLYQRGGRDAWLTAAELAERLGERWRREARDGDDDTLLLRLRTQLANVYRSLCDFDRAREIDRDALLRQRRVLGLNHLRTLMTARSYAADLRLTGEFEEALDVDQSTWQAFAGALGHEHLMTIIASTNMALSEYLCGDVENALRQHQADLSRCERVRSQRPWQRPWILLLIGTLQRELGWYDESRRSLEDALYDFDNLVAGGASAQTAWGVIHASAGLAITERRLGRPAVSMTRDTLERCRAAYGDLYPGVFALELSLAGDLHASGDHGAAADKARAARNGIRSIFGDGHPFTGISEVDLSIYALAAGQAPLADTMSEKALDALEATLSAEHPWVQAGRVARANVLAVSGRPADALPLEQHVHAEYQRRLGPGNPLLRTITINHANTRMLLNQPGAIPDSEAGMRRRSAIEIDFPLY